MTTAVHQKPAAAPAPPTPAKVIFQGQINVDLVDVKEQVRKKFDENAHKELTESVRTKGVINPVTLRPGKKDGRFELVAGERRFRAARAARLTSIPAVVRELDDQSAALYQVEENIHRKDLTPIEEARGFKLLLEAKKFTVEQLAQLVDKSMPYVYRAVHLLELPKKILDQIEAGDLTPAHGHQLLRIPADEREEAFSEFMDDWQWGDEGKTTAKHLAEYIDGQFGHQLSSAPFPKDKPYAGVIACTGCPSNSGNQGALFDGATKGQCMLSSCFDKKVAAVNAEQTKEAEKKAADLKAKHGAQFIGVKDEKINQGDMVAAGVALCPVGSKNEKNVGKDKRIVVGADGKAWVVTSDKAAIMKVMGHIPWSMQSSSGGGRKVKARSPKKCFTDAWLERQFFLKLCAETKPYQMLQMIVDECTPGYMSKMIRERVALLGINGDAGVKKEAASLDKVEDLTRLAFKLTLANRTAYGQSADHAKDLGFDFKAFEKANTVAAEKAWDDRKAKR